MSDSPFGSVPSGQASWTPPAPVQKASQAPVIIAVVVSLLALGLAAAAFFKPKHDDAPAAPQYSDQQVADAKKNVCDAYNLIRRAVNEVGSVTSEDQTLKFMLSLNTRLSFNTAADQLFTVSGQNPAAPSGLLNAAEALGASYRKIVLALTATAGDDELKPLYESADTAIASIKQACG